MYLTKSAAIMEQYVDKFAFGSLLTLAVENENFAPFLHRGMKVTIKVTEDMEQTEGLKLLRLGPSVYLAWFQRYGDAIYVNSPSGLRGTYSIEQVERFPIAVLGNIIEIE